MHNMDAFFPHLNKESSMMCAIVCACVCLVFGFQSRISFSATLYIFFSDFKTGLQREMFRHRPSELAAEAVVGEKDGSTVLPVVDTSTPIMR